MPALQQTDQNRTANRARKLSPELSEFLHMLDALEDQFAEQPGRPVRKS